MTKKLVGPPKPRVLKTTGPPHYRSAPSPDKRRARNRRWYARHREREQAKARARYWKKKLEGYE